MTTNEIWHGKSELLIPRIEQQIHCIVADPPYGVNFVSRRAEMPDGKKFVKAIANDRDLASALALFEHVFTLLAEKVGEQGEAYVFTRWDIVGAWYELINDLEPTTGFKYKMMLVWDKGVPGMGDIDSNWGCGHELILYCKRGRRELPYRRSGIIHVDKLGSKQHVHPCLPPGEMVLTDAGFRPIETVGVGDRVYSHDGTFQSVTHVHEAPHDDEVTTVAVRGTTDRTTTTGNHPFLVHRPATTRNDRSSDWTGWLPARDLAVGDYLLTPRMQCSASGGPDASMAWVAGLWLAEGSILKSGHGDSMYPQFAIHQDERWMVDRMRAAFPDVNIGVYDKPDCRGLQLVIFDRELGSEFVQLFGRGSRKKSISPTVWTWGVDARRALLDGYIDGDGWRRDREVRAKTSSPDLAATLALLAEGLGLNVAMRSRQGGSAVIAGRSVNANPHWAMEFRVPSAPHSAVWFEGREYTARYVRSVERDRYVGPVWNLTVADTHTFQTYVGMTHNTEKPAGLIEKLIEMSTDPGDWVVDPFSGSGSTSVAAQRLGRNSIGIEAEERYVDVARRRLDQLTLI